MMEKLVTCGSSLHNKNKMNTAEMKTHYLKSKIQQIVFNRTSDKAKDRSIKSIQTETQNSNNKRALQIMRNSVKTYV